MNGSACQIPDANCLVSSTRSWCGARVTTFTRRALPILGNYPDGGSPVGWLRLGSRLARLELLARGRPEVLGQWPVVGQDGALSHGPAEGIAVGAVKAPGRGPLLWTRPGARPPPGTGLLQSVRTFALLLRYGS